ncbi:MAG: hypothetical protein ACFE8M_07985 [Candidatus Hermodarchaeota archaeon]
MVELELEVVDYLQGSFSLIFVLISLIIGFTILLKYSKYKSRLYILVGISWIGVANPWFPDSINFIMILASGFQDVLYIGWYLIIGNCFIPIALLSWLIAFTDMIVKKKQKLVITLTIILSIAFEVMFFYLFFTDINAIGAYSRPFTVNFGDFILIYLVIVILVMFVTGLIFAQKSAKSEDKEVRVKGKLLRAAFITFTIAAVLDSLLGTIFEDPTDPLLAIMVVIVRVLLIISAIEFYGGFLLPRWMHAIFIREK